MKVKNAYRIVKVPVDTETVDPDVGQTYDLKRTLPFVVLTNGTNASVNQTGLPFSLTPFDVVNLIIAGADVSAYFKKQVTFSIGKGNPIKWDGTSASDAVFEIDIIELYEVEDSLEFDVIDN